MTVSTTTLRNDYAGNGSTTAFTGSFYILDASHVKVIRTDNSTTPPTVTTLTLNSDYTISNMSASGFTVNMTTAPTSTQNLTILRNVPLTQLTHYVPNDPFPAASHENALDQLTMEAQQIQEELNRTLTLPAQITGVSAALPTPSAGLCLKWAPDGKSIINSTNDPDTVAAQAQTSANNAATSATNAATSATNAANSATAAGNSATAASNSASQAQTSAANAQAAASSVGFRNVKFLTHANSPYNVTAADSGYLISIDTSLGNVAVNLPAIGSLTLPFSIGFKKSTTDANSVTLTAGGTDKFDSGSASKTISTGGAGTTLVPEASTNPAEWVASDWGALGGQQSKQQFAAGTDFTAGTSTTVTLTNTPLPGSAQSLELFFDGSYQQASEWSYNPTNGVVTFTSAIPAGVSKIEAVWATPLVVGTPADGTVTGAKIATGDAANIRTAIGAASPADVSAAVPAGTIIDFAGTAAPTGFLACPIAPTNISRTTYANLFSAIGTTWGAGDGSTTFGMPYFPADYASVQANANVGSSTVGQVISHTHTVGIGISGGNAQGGSNVLGGGPTTTGSTGGPANLAAGIRVMKCVKY